ncbi:MerR family transcriptional regulator [Pseudoxanthomonas dokdonensis]|uniref:Mercuric resistance operon regulatory protein n=1 Tax=Pseudoxanthomonas dokdonensis TaxID=344882 RepID=A0A0R0CR24_9GAMM|nr:MerR family DNA-binding protein [Pseudoxanthomonas dokdonensis]KRG68471.1 MerR family transcriptional regulator [Pseudoxanthomonas dokdonensis]
MDLSIARFAEAGGVGVETVRFYQRKGLLPVPARAGGIRRYGESDVRQLRFIRMAQRAGFSLGEIGELIALDSGQDRRRVRELAQARLLKLEQQIAELQQARDSLRQLAGQCADGAPGPCPILAAFDAGAASM